MSTQEETLASARLFRPNMFDDTYIGNTNMKKAIKRTMTSARLPQVILLTGTAGTGKTTAGRILAKYYRCENRKEDGSACDECISCQNFNEYIKTGNSEILDDFRFIDSAQTGKVDDVDRLIEEASYATYEKYRVYIFDECHAMSLAAQTRLLLFLEEPPEDILVILCTTDLHKMLDTIVSRCTAKFYVVKPKLEELMGLLEHISKERNYTYDKKALRIIATRADLAQRASINKLDEIAGQYNNEISYENVVEAMELMSDNYLIKFYEIMLADFIRIDRYITHVGEIKESVGVKTFITELISFTIRGMYVINGVQVAGLDEAEIKIYKRLFGNLNVVEVGGLLKHITGLASLRDADAEIMLLQLGFIGLRNERAMNTHLKEGEKETILLDAKLLTKDKEKEAEQKNYDNLLHPTEQVVESFIETRTKPIESASVLADMFGTALVKPE